MNVEIGAEAALFPEYINGIVVAMYGSSLGSNPEERVLKKLSLAGLAKLSQFGLASGDFRGLRIHNRPVYTAGYFTAKAVDRGDKRTRRVRDRDFVKFE